MGFYWRVSRKRKDGRELEQKLLAEGLKVERVCVHSKDDGYYLMVNGKYSNTMFKPATAKQDFPETNPDHILDLKDDASVDRKIHEIISTEYKKEGTSNRNVYIGLLIGAAYGLSTFFWPGADDLFTLDVYALSVPTVMTACLIIGARLDDRRFNRKNIPWAHDELKEPYQVSVR